MKAKLLSLACPKWILRSGLQGEAGKQRELKAAEDGKAIGSSRAAVGRQMLFSPAPAFAFYHQKHGKVPSEREGCVWPRAEAANFCPVRVG